MNLRFRKVKQCEEGMRRADYKKITDNDIMTFIKKFINVDEVRHITEFDRDFYC